MMSPAEASEREVHAVQPQGRLVKLLMCCSVVWYYMKWEYVPPRHKKQKSTPGRNVVSTLPDLCAKNQAIEGVTPESYFQNGTCKAHGLPKDN